MALSPKTTQFMQEDQGPADKEEAFNQLLEESARTKLISVLPDIEQQLVTFKVLEADADKGNAVAAYVIDLGGYEGYIPVVMADGDIRAPTAVYDPNSKMFLPLTKEWINEIQRGATQDMGEASKEDPTAVGDLDITSLVRPPYTGRFVYASESKPLKLIPALRSLPAREKVAFTEALKSDRALLKMAATIYGPEVLVSALKDNTAAPAARVKKATAFVFATRDTPATQIKASFGELAGDAMRTITKHGYAVKDSRESVNAVVNTDTTMRLHSVTKSGVYSLYKEDGDSQDALVIVEPFGYNKRVFGNPHYNPDDIVESRRWAHHEKRLDVFREQHMLIIRPDGGYTEVEGAKLLAKIPDSLEPDREVFPSLTDAPRVPRPGETGVFVKRDKDTVHGTDIIHVKGVRDSDGTKTITSDDSNRRYILSPDIYSLRAISDDVTMVPSTYTFIPVKFDTKASYATDPLELSKYLGRRLKTAGCYELKAWKGSYGYLTNIDRQEQSSALTAIKIAGICNLPVSEADAIVSTVDSRGSFTGYILTPRVKVAYPQGQAQQGMDPNMPPPGPPQGDPQQGMDPNAAQGMDPNAAPLDPDGQPLPQEPPPSPESEALITAIQDVHGTITAAHDKEMSAMQERAKSLEMQSAALESVSSRMQEVMQGIPQEQSPALANLDAMAAQVGSDPTQGQPMGPQDPSQGAMQGQQPADGAAMADAGGVPDPSVFDTSALAQLGRSSSVGATFAEYIPDLTSGIDHLNRMLLTLEMNRSDLNERVSHADLDALESRLQNVIDDSSSLLLDITKKISTLSAV